MAEAAVIQMNGTNGLSDENRPPTENHVNGSAGELSAEKKSSSSSSHKSSHGDKHRSSSSHKSSHGDKHRSSSSHKSSHGDKHRSSSSSGHKSSSKDKDRDHHSSSKHKSSSKDKDRDKDRSSSSKHHSSSSKHSSSSSKHGSSSSSSKHHSSSSSSSKHKSSSHDKHRSDKDKHRSDSDREKHRSDKDKHRSDKPKDEVKQEVEVKPVIKEEPAESPVKVSMNHIAASSEDEEMKPVVKEEPRPAMDDSDDDVPLSARKAASKPEKRYIEESDGEDFEPKKVKKEASKKRKNEDDDFEPDEPKKKKKKEVKKEPKAVKQEPKMTPKKSPVTPAKKGNAGTQNKMKKEKKEGDNQTKWKWWEEEPKNDGVKWTFLEHKGPVFAPPYEPLPPSVRFFYDGEQMQLSEAAEEVGGFYAKMLDHDYTTREVFNTNFFKDWRRVMSKEEQRTITDLSKCNFKEMYQFFKEQSEQRKNRTKEQKKQLKEENAALQAEYGFCTMDGHQEKIGNFRIEPPGLFRGRGDHPKQGMLKTRTLPEDIIINCSRDSNVPQPPEGHRWKEVRHDNQVTWLASWTENIQGATKYIMLAPTSKLKGAKDWQKYEMARKLHKIVDTIRATYREDFKSKEMKVRQRAVALYFIDKLALRAGNEKDDSETADTVGCCSLRVEHINLHETLAGQEYVVEFDFLGKDSIRYYNKVPVEKRVFKNLQLFKENKNEGDDLFDRLNTTIMNKHLNTLMPGLSAKVFRTYNASRTLQEQLNIMTNADDSVAARMLSYNRANRAVAVLCNHQRAAPKNFSKQMENLQNKIDAKRDQVKDCKREVKQAKSDLKAFKTAKAKTVVEKKKKSLARLEEQLMKLEVQATDKDENKEIALGTSKLNYLDPRISVAWCKKWDVPVEKVYNKTQREKFAWAIDMTEEDYDFMNLDGVAEPGNDGGDDDGEEEEED